MLRSFAVMIVSVGVILAQAKNAPPCFPTAVGTKWVYDEDGTEVTETITASEAKDGGVVVSVGSVDAAGKTIPYEKYHVSDWSLFRLERDGIPDRPVVGLLIVPLKPDDRSKPEAIRTPAGLFSAYPFKFKNTELDLPLSTTVLPLHETRWYAPGVGMVKSELSYPRGEATVVLSTKALKKISAK